MLKPPKITLYFHKEEIIEALINYSEMNINNPKLLVASTDTNPVLILEGEHIV